MGFGCLAIKVGFGSVGNGVEGNGGRVVIDGIGGNVAFGRGGAGGGATAVCRRWRAAMLISMLDQDNVILIINNIMKHSLREALVYRRSWLV